MIVKSCLRGYSIASGCLPRLRLLLLDLYGDRLRIASSVIWPAGSYDVPSPPKWFRFARRRLVGSLRTFEVSAVLDDVECLFDSPPSENGSFFSSRDDATQF